MFCNMCGQKLPDDSKFCVNCGAKVIAPSPKATQAPPNSSYSYVPPKGTAREVIYEPGKRPDILNARKPINHESRAFCNNCGAVLRPDVRFCTQCGKAVGVMPEVNIKSAPTEKTNQHTTTKPKKRTLRIIAWILLILNAVAAIGGFSDGTISAMLHGGIAGILEMLGYFTPAIIAGILFHIDGKHNKN